MDLKPVSSYPEPQYPKKELFIDHPEIFDRYLPSRWGIAKLSAGALASALLSCSNVNSPIATPIQNTESNPHGPNSFNQHQADAQVHNTDTFYVAPLFLHGEGTGVTGCVMMTPPVFVSESEAYDIIVRTLEEHGLNINNKDTVLDSASLIRHVPVSKNEKCYDSTTNLPFTLSGYNNSYKTGFKYVDIFLNMQLNNDCGCNGDGTWKPCPSITNYDTKETAIMVADELRRVNSLNAGVFYDPCADTIEKSRSLLRAQVVDFIKYLQNHDVLPSTSVLKD